jgi:hypothetical protein
LIQQRGLVGYEGRTGAEGKREPLIELLTVEGDRETAGDQREHDAREEVMDVPPADLDVAPRAHAAADRVGHRAGSAERHAERDREVEHSHPVGRPAR